MRRGRLIWVGEVTPSTISSTYTLRIDFVVGKRPDVTVLSPELERPPGGALTHVFPGDRLCLHFPGEWDSSKSIATTIIPWASEWLVQYEIWAVTGNWNGGGHEPSAQSSRWREPESLPPERAQVRR